MPHLADELARWATDLDPAPSELALANRALVDTLGGGLAARNHLAARLRDCVGDLADDLLHTIWAEAPGVLRTYLSPRVLAEASR